MKPETLKKLIQVLDGSIYKMDGVIPSVHDVADKLIEHFDIRPKGPGRPALGIETKTKRIPVDIESQIDKLINDYKNGK